MAIGGLFVVGELNVDLIFNQIVGFPSVGTEIVARDMTLTLGSSSAILAANAAAIGLPTAFCGVIGRDAYGELVIRELKKQGVNTDFVITSDVHQTGITVVLNYDQDRANVTYCGAMETLTIHDIPWPDIAQFQHFHISNIFLQKGIIPDIAEIFHQAKRAGLSTSLDLQWDVSNHWDFDYRACLPYVDIFFPNETELLALTQSEDLKEGIEKLKPYTNTIAVKLGEIGSLGVHRDLEVLAKAYQGLQYVDAVGAGDSFNAGFLKKYLEKASLQECLQFGNMMGALNTTAAGGTKAFQDETALADKIQSLRQSSL